MTHSFGSENTARKNVHNADAVAIKAGAPVFYDSTATAADKLGFHAVAADSLAAVDQPLFIGLAVRDIPVGERGSVQSYGFFQEARVVKMTRAATTDIFASYSAGAIGDIMSFITVTGVQALTRSGAGSATNQGWFAVLQETFVSSTTQASGVNALLTFGDSLKVFVRGV